MATLDFTTKPLALVILIHDLRKAKNILADNFYFISKNIGEIVVKS